MRAILRPDHKRGRDGRTGRSILDAVHHLQRLARRPLADHVLRIKAQPSSRNSSLMPPPPPHLNWGDSLPLHTYQNKHEHATTQNTQKQVIRKHLSRRGETPKDKTTNTSHSPEKNIESGPGQEIEKNKKTPKPTFIPSPVLSSGVSC